MMFVMATRQVYTQDLAELHSWKYLQEIGRTALHFYVGKKNIPIYSAKTTHFISILCLFIISPVLAKIILWTEITLRGMIRDNVYLQQGQGL